jgi:predicted nucleic acid-binding protein
MERLLFDSSIYITAFRNDDPALRAGPLAQGSSIWLSSVVLEELYAGANRRDRYIVERLERDFDRARRILVPNLRDWSKIGKLLAALAAQYHYEQIARGRLTNDALIVSSAARAGITVITSNARDFARLAEFRPFAWRVVNPWNKRPESA